MRPFATGPDRPGIMASSTSVVHTRAAADARTGQGEREALLALLQRQLNGEAAAERAQQAERRATGGAAAAALASTSAGYLAARGCVTRLALAAVAHCWQDMAQKVDLALPAAHVLVSSCSPLLHAGRHGLAHAHRACTWNFGPCTHSVGRQVLT